MSRAAAILKRVDKVLSSLNASDRKAYKRFVLKSGGDPLTGHGVSVSVTDVLMDPPPAVSYIGPESNLLLTSGGMAQLGDRLCIVSPNAISRAELADVNTLIVFKEDSDNPGPEEVCSIVGFVPLALNGVDVTYSLVLRSKKR